MGRSAFLNFILAGAVSLVGAAELWAGDGTKPIFVDDRGIAIGGYDVVAYHTDSKAVHGSDSFQFTWQGAQWMFTSAAHRNLFAKEPERYAPQYGGYCAYGMSRGYKAIIDPTAFTIIDGKLYLNYSTRVQDTWRKDTRGYVGKADAHWPQVQSSTEIKR